MENRIFTFGCSFTHYEWPTWADIILKGNNGYNLGVRGGGFDMILYRIIEADRVFNFNNNDTIIVMFTTPLRMDLIYSEDNPSWSQQGQVITSYFVKHYNELYSINGLLYKSFNDMHIIKNYLDNRNLKYYFSSINTLFEEYYNNEPYFRDEFISHEILDFINLTKKEIKLDFDDMMGFFYKNKIKYKIWKNSGLDYHPTPKYHYKWVTDVLLKKLDIKLNVSYDEIIEIENELFKIKDSSDCVKILNEKFPYFYENKKNYTVYLK